MDPHVLGDAVEGVEAADGADVQGAVGVHVPDHKADVVEVRRDAEGVPFAAQIGNDAALVGQIVREAELVQNFAEHFLDVFVHSRGAVGGKKALERVDAVLFVKWF